MKVCAICTAQSFIWLLCNLLCSWHPYKVSLRPLMMAPIQSPQRHPLQIMTLSIKSLLYVLENSRTLRCTCMYTYSTNTYRNTAWRMITYNLGLWLNKNCLQLLVSNITALHNSTTPEPLSSTSTWSVFFQLIGLFSFLNYCGAISLLT